MSGCPTGRSTIFEPLAALRNEAPVRTGGLGLTRYGYPMITSDTAEDSLCLTGFLSTRDHMSPA